LFNKFDVLPKGECPEVRHKDYDWTLALEDCVE
jgi:hypothetical protein